MKDFGEVVLKDGTVLKLKSHLIEKGKKYIITLPIATHNQKLFSDINEELNSQLGADIVFVNGGSVEESK